jgi:hypothetical protein
MSVAFAFATDFAEAIWIVDPSIISNAGIIARSLLVRLMGSFRVIGLS